jgi:hypothetical protein
MEIRWNYCTTADGTGLLIINGKVYKMRPLDEAISIVQALINAIPNLQ